MLELDVTDREAVFAAIEGLPAGFDEPNVCIANAGLALGLEPAHQAQMSDWEQMIATNINGLVYTVRALLPGMVERNQGHVVLLGSVAGDYPYPGGNVYGATKAFVKQFAAEPEPSAGLGRARHQHRAGPGRNRVRPRALPWRRRKGEPALSGHHADDGRGHRQTIFWSCTLPRHLNINRMQMMPITQAFSPFAIQRS